MENSRPNPKLARNLLEAPVAASVKFSSSEGIVVSDDIGGIVSNGLRVALLAVWIHTLLKLHSGRLLARVSIAVKQKGYYRYCDTQRCTVPSLKQGVILSLMSALFSSVTLCSGFYWHVD